MGSTVQGQEPYGCVVATRTAIAEHFFPTAIAAVWALIGGVTPYPRAHALGATAAALLFYVALHAGIGVVFLVSNLLRLGAGFLSPRRRMDLRLTRLWLDYTLWTGVVALGLVLALPWLAAMLGARP